MTNNLAEWNALLCALEAFPIGNDMEIDIWTDSMLVSQQLSGAWRCKNGRLRELRDIALDLLQKAGKWTIYWHSRTENVKRFGH